jgi:hypothetical protein
MILFFQKGVVKNMWGSWFGYSSYKGSFIPSGDNKEYNKEELKEYVYLLDGTLRVPLELPNRVKKDFRLLRQWVFDSISGLPLEENVEYYTFKELPNNYVYWYSLYESKRSTPIGILMKVDPQNGWFTGIANPDEELPQVPVQEKPLEQTNNSIVGDDNKTLIAPAITKRSIRLKTPSKRIRSKK